MVLLRIKKRRRKSEMRRHTKAEVVNAEEHPEMSTDVCTLTGTE